MTKYQVEKEKARQEAIEWQLDLFENGHEYSIAYYLIFQLYFEYLGKKYGLLKEFRENGII